MVFQSIIIITEKNKTIDVNLSFGAANYDFGTTCIGTDIWIFSVIHRQH